MYLFSLINRGSSRKFKSFSWNSNLSLNNLVDLFGLFVENKKHVMDMRFLSTPRSNNT
jgi:hypothetical protein